MSLDDAVILNAWACIVYGTLLVSYGIGLAIRKLRNK